MANAKKSMSRVYEEYVDGAWGVFSRKRNQIIAFVALFIVVAGAVRYVDFGDVHTLVWLILNTAFSSVFIVRKVQAGVWNPYDFLDLYSPKAGGCNGNYREDI